MAQAVELVEQAESAGCDGDKEERFGGRRGDKCRAGRLRWQRMQP
jgi:hypothetical protein